MGKLGHKSKRGVGELYDEPKSEKLVLNLTSTSRRLLQERAENYGLSLQELVERWARGTLSDIDTK